MIEADFKLRPRWRQALREMEVAGLLVFDATVSKRQIADWMGLGVPVTAADQRAFELAWLEQFGQLRAELLESFRLDLVTQHGKSSFRICLPNQQSRLAIAEGEHELKRAVRRMARRVAFVQVEHLTDAERVENANAQARVGALQSIINRRKLTHE